MESTQDISVQPSHRNSGGSSPHGSSPQAKAPSDGKSQSGSYGAALVFLASIIPAPIAALVATTAIYILPSPSLFTNLANAISWLPGPLVDILCGLTITILLWLVLAIPLRFAAAKQNAQQASFQHISSHLLSLKTCAGYLGYLFWKIGKVCPPIKIRQTSLQCVSQWISGQ